VVPDEDILFVSKPLAPPWDDSGKVLPYLVAREVRGLRLRVPVPRGQPLDLPHLRCEEVYRESWSWSVPLGDKARLLARLLRGDLPPVVHFFFSPNAPTTLAARVVRWRHPGVRVVQTVMSLPAQGAALEQGLFGDVAITWSRQGAERLREVVRRHGLRCRVVHVPPGVEEGEPSTPEQRLMLRESLDLPPGAPMVLYAGDLEFGSAARTVAEALPPVIERTGAVFVFASRPKTPAAEAVLRDLRKTLSRWEGEGRVRFLGRVERFRDLLRAADVQVLPAETTFAKTDLPLVLLEGLMCGVPAIVGTGTPMDELVEVGAALGVPPGRPDALTSVLRELLSRDGAAAALGAGGRAVALRRHSPAAMGAAHEAIYRDLLGRT